MITFEPMKVQVQFPDGRVAWLDEAHAGSSQVVAMGGRVMEPLPRLNSIGFEVIGQTLDAPAANLKRKRKTNAH